MARLRRPRWLLAASLAGLAAGALAADCPPGQRDFCLGGSCLCVPGSAGDGSAYETLGELAAGGLEAWILQARAAAGARGEPLPMPLHIRAQLEPFFDLAVLDTARYRVGDIASLDAANAVFQNPHVNAVTLVDLILFRRAEDAENDAALWAHELTHVRQYLEWGSAEFARRYSRDHMSVERPAYAMQRRVAEALGEGAP